MTLLTIDQHLDALFGDYNSLSEMLGETYTQYQSEMHLYGDAWAGSRDELNAMQADLNEIERKIDVANRIKANLQG